MFIIHSMIAVLASITVTAQQPQPKTIPQQMERAIVSVLVGQQTMLEQNRKEINVRETETLNHGQKCLVQGTQ